MARLIGGINGKLEGKIGNMYYYTINGQTVARARRKVSKVPPSTKQLASRQRMKVVQQYLIPLVQFVKTTYAEVCLRKMFTPYNAATSELLKNAVRGEYLDYNIDPALVVISKGKLQIPQDAAVLVSEGHLQFSWNGNGYKWPISNDRAIMLAYALELGEVIYDLCGAARHVGKDTLYLDDSWIGKTIDTYVAFRSEKGDKTSESVYTGSFIF